MNASDKIKASPVILDPNVRHDFEFEWHVENGNPNGDPDAGGAIRQTPDGHAMATDVCAKRWVRDYMEEVAGKSIFISRYIQDKLPKGKGTLKWWADLHDVKNGKDAIRTFIDVRLFGGVVLLTKKATKSKKDDADTDTNNVKDGENAQILGPLQIGYGFSTVPVDELDVGITRVARQEDDDSKGTMGTRQMVAKAIMVQRGRYSGHLGKRAGVSSDDLELFWTALIEGTDLRRSTMRGKRHFARLTVLTFPDAYGHGEPVKTELLFEDVWEKYGQKKAS